MHTHLSIQEREVISQLYAQWLSFSEIWRRINRSHTTIMREINRNWKENRWKMKIKYSCIDADNKARIRRFNANHRRTKLLKIPRLYHLVYEKLKDESKIWSPDNIAWRLKLERNISISKVTIYRFIHECKPQWEIYLRYKKFGYKKRWIKKITRFQTCPSIHERELVVDNRERIWDWEWDSVIWSGNNVLWILHERKSRYIQIAKLPNWEAKYTTYNIVENLKWAKTLTVDRWSEFAYRYVIKERLWIEVYMTDPYSSRQKWWIERNNREIRVYLPKWISFDDIPNEQIQKIALWINSKPRKELWYRTSREVFHSTNYHLL